MSNHIYLGNIKNKKRLKLITNITIGLFIIFSAVYLYMASTIGIYVNGYFFKKSPSLTTINYNSISSNSAIENINLKSNIDGSYEINIDDETIVISNISNDAQNTTFDILEGEMIDDNFAGVNSSDLALIALQKLEARRQPIILYIIPLLILSSMALFRHYSTEIHQKLFKDKIFSEKYFTFVDYLPIYTSYIFMLLLTITL